MVSNAVPPNERFTRRERLSLDRDYRAVFARRRSVAGQWLVIYGRANELAYNRLGTSVGRKFGSATERNRFKRLVREAFRSTKAEQPRGWDYVVVPIVRKSLVPFVSTPPTLPVLRQEFVDLARRLTVRPKPRSKKDPSDHA